MKAWINKYLIDTNLWVAFCFTALLAFFQLSFYKINELVLGIAFFGTLSIYNFTRIKSVKSFWQFKQLLQPNILWTQLSIAVTLVLILLRGFEPKVFIYLALLGVISFCYSLPFSRWGLRGIPFLKLFLIALIWAGTSIGLLLMVHHDFFEHPFLLMAVFCYVVGITIPFDIRDQTTDERSLRTIPQSIGVKKSIVLALFSLIGSALFFYAEAQTFSLTFYSWLTTLFMALLFIGFSNEKRGYFYFSFWGESLSALPLLTYLVLEFIQ